MRRSLILVGLALIVARGSAAAPVLSNCWGGGRCNDRAIGPETEVIPMHLDQALGKVLVADSPGQIREELTDGTIHLVAPSAKQVTSAVYAPDGAVVWAQFDQLFVTRNGSTTALPSTGLHRAQDLAFVDGNLWIADSYNDSGSPGGGIYVLQYPPATGAQPVLVLKSAFTAGNYVPPSQAPVWMPQGVAPGKGNTLLIADTANHRIRRYMPSSGALVTVAGGGDPDANGRYQSGYAGDGAVVGPSTRFNSPLDMLEAPDGSLFIADYSNHRVRKIDGTTGILTTVLGNGTWSNGSIIPDAGTDPTKFPAALPIGVALKGSTLYVSSGNDKRVRCLTDMLGPPQSPLASTATMTRTILATQTPLPPCRATATVAPTGTPQGPCVS